jgi:hypothetical protein
LTHFSAREGIEGGGRAFTIEIDSKGWRKWRMWALEEEGVPFAELLEQLELFFWVSAS